MEKNFKKVRASFIKSEHQYDEYASRHNFTLDDRLLHVAKMKNHYCRKIHWLSNLYDISLDAISERLEEIHDTYFSKEN